MVDGGRPSCACEAAALPSRQAASSLLNEGVSLSLCVCVPCLIKVSGLQVSSQALVIERERERERERDVCSEAVRVCCARKREPRRRTPSLAMPRIITIQALSITHPRAPLHIHNLHYTSTSSITHPRAPLHIYLVIGTISAIAVHHGRRR